MGHKDLRRIAVAAIVCALAASLLPWEPVRLVAAAPLAVFLPGYAIVAAAFGPHRLDLQRLTMLVLACGLSALCLGGLALNYLPGGLRTATWALLLTLVVLASSQIAAVRRTKPGWDRGRARGPLRARPVDIACGVAALSAVVGALALAYTPLSADDATGYTALWMLPGDSGPPGSIRVGVLSAEQQSRGYELRVRSGASREPLVYHLALDPDGEEVFEVPVKARARGSTRVAASLYRQGHPGDLYRRVTTWLRPRVEGR
jgi:hypothetical protein